MLIQKGLATTNILCISNACHQAYPKLPRYTKRTSYGTHLIRQTHNWRYIGKQIWIAPNDHIIGECQVNATDILFNAPAYLHCERLCITGKKTCTVIFFIYKACIQSVGQLKAVYTSPPGRPANSGINSASLGSILATQQLRVKTIHSHFHHCL